MEIKRKAQPPCYDGYCTYCGAIHNKDVTKPCHSCGKRWMNPDDIKDVIFALIEDKDINHQLFVIDTCVKEGAFTLEKGH